MAHRSLLFALVPFLCACASAVRAQDAPPATGPRSHFNVDEGGLALQGYDPVAYFPVGGGKPHKGSASLTATHEGALYRFASEEHRALFLARPDSFAPQYGGWCAYAMADGEKVEIDPESFLVTDGKLILFFDAWYADTRAKWRKDEKRLKEEADRAWKELVTPKPEPVPPKGS